MVKMPAMQETQIPSLGRRKEYLDNTSNSNVILRYNYEDLFIMKIRERKP